MTPLGTALERMRNTPGLARDLIITVCVVAVGGVAFASIFRHYDFLRPGAERYTFSAEFDQAPAVQLASRQEIRIAGVSVGKILDAKPTAAGRALLTFSLEPGHQVFQNARLIMRSKTPLNVMYVTLDPGGPPAQPLPENGTIPLGQTDRVTQPYEVLDDLDTRARAALTDLVDDGDVALAHAATDLPSGVSALNGAISSFDPLVSAMQERRENLRRLVTAVAEISQAAGDDDERLASLADSLESTLGVVAADDEQLGTALERLPGVTTTLRESMHSAAQLTDELTPTLEHLTGASAQLPDALDHLVSTVRNLRGVLTKAKPVIAKAKPVVADLRPLAGNLKTTFGDLKPVSATLPQATARLVPWLTNLGAFVYQTSSSFSLGDANGGLGRANLVLKVLDPTGGGL